MRGAHQVSRVVRASPAFRGQGLRALSEEAGEELPSYAADLQAASGVPGLSRSRKVIIYSPARTAGQQGLAQTIEGGEDRSGSHG